MKFWLSACMALLCVCGAARTEAGHIPSRLIVFGDSLSDTGNAFTLAGGGFPFTGPGAVFPNPPYFGGRLSNGPVWVEQLADRWGLPAPTPSLLGGTNYAFGAAETGSGVSSLSTPNLGTQVGAFQLDVLGGGLTLDGNELFIVWGGGNDFPAALGMLPPLDPAVVVGNLVQHLTDLIATGGQHFLVPNQPLLGETPQAQAVFLDADPANDFVPGLLNAQSVAFNALLESALTDLELANPSVEIQRLDIFGLFGQIEADPIAFGLLNTSSPSFINGVGIVSDPNTTLFWDGNHPTARGHQIIAEAAVAAVVPEPGSLLLACVGVFAMAVGARRSRRRQTHVAA